MIETACGSVRELIPDVSAGRAAPEDVVVVERHVETCGECRAEYHLASLLVASIPAAPAGLADRVAASVLVQRTTPSRPWWGVSAAAVAALALGIGFASEPVATGEIAVPGYAQETDEGTVWGSEDGLVAGAPLFDDLTDEALEQLLVELSVGSAGGAV